jgi:thiamine-phosphate pyrophosphorylase
VKLASPLYVILDREATRGRDLGDVLEAVLAGGCRFVQLREKSRALAEVWPQARALRARSAAAGATFIVNDRVDLALALDADGVHVGQEDLPPAVARRLLRPGMVLGVSTHDEEQADQAIRDGADYVAVGSMFPTTTKSGFQLVGPDLLRRVRARTTAPLVAIGGITEDNVAPVMAAGADAVAVISAVCGASDPEAAVRRLLERIRAAEKPCPNVDRH